MFLSSNPISWFVDFENAIVGFLIVMFGVIVIFVGNYFSKKIGILHVVIYFMGSFVILTGILLLLLYGEPSII